MIEVNYFPIATEILYTDGPARPAFHSKHSRDRVSPTRAGPRCFRDVCSPGVSISERTECRSCIYFISVPSGLCSVVSDLTRCTAAAGPKIHPTGYPYKRVQKRPQMVVLSDLIMEKLWTQKRTPRVGSWPRNKNEMPLKRREGKSTNPPRILP